MLLTFCRAQLYHGGKEYAHQNIAGISPHSRRYVV